MQFEIDAVYENGVFKPLVPVSLPNGTKVKLIIVVEKRIDLSRIKTPDFLRDRLKKIKRLYSRQLRL